MGKQKVDELAVALHLTIENRKPRIVNAAIVNEKNRPRHIGRCKNPANKVLGFDVKKADTMEQAEILAVTMREL
jgi:hypothetical protein